MTNEEYLLTQQQLMTLAQLITQLDLDSFINRITRANTFGPILDPTLYKRGASKMEQIEKIARAAREFQKTAKEAINQLKGEMVNESCGVNRQIN